MAFLLEKGYFQKILEIIEFKLKKLNSEYNIIRDLKFIIDIK